MLQKCSKSYAKTLYTVKTFVKLMAVFFQLFLDNTFLIKWAKRWLFDDMLHHLYLSLSFFFFYNVRPVFLLLLLFLLPFLSVNFLEAENKIVATLEDPCCDQNVKGFRTVFEEETDIRNSSPNGNLYWECHLKCLYLKNRLLS